MPSGALVDFAIGIGRKMNKNDKLEGLKQLGKGGIYDLKTTAHNLRPNPQKTPKTASAEASKKVVRGQDKPLACGCRSVGRW